MTDKMFNKILYLLSSKTYGITQVPHTFSYNLGQITEQFSVTLRFIIKISWLVFNSLGTSH